MTKVSNPAKLICRREGHRIYFLPSPETLTDTYFPVNRAVSVGTSQQSVYRSSVLVLKPDPFFLGRVKTRYSSRSTLLE